MRGFVLVIDEGQAGDGHDSLARVCRDYDVETVHALEEEIAGAAVHARNQLRLAAARGALVSADGAQASSVAADV